MKKFYSEPDVKIIKLNNVEIMVGSNGEGGDAGGFNPNPGEGGE